MEKKWTNLIQQPIDVQTILWGMRFAAGTKTQITSHRRWWIYTEERTKNHGIPLSTMFTGFMTATKV